MWSGSAKQFLPLKRLPEMVSTADIFVIIGTSMNVYPAAGLINYVPEASPIYVIDPNEVSVAGLSQR